MPQVLKKKPVQERSKATVEAIYEAAGQVLAKEGLARTTTHRIAKRAGVSVGTLYQYFPNKQAIFEELLREYRKASLERLSSALAGAWGAPIEEIIDVAIACFTLPFFENPEVSSALMQHRDHFAKPAERQETMEAAQRLIVMAMEAREDIPKVPDPDMVAFTLVRVAEALSLATVVERPDAMLDGRHKRELKHLAVAYLMTPRGADA